MQPKKLETYHETRYVEEVVKDGSECIKLYKRGWPDRLTLMDFNIHFFIEFKREGEVPRKLQKHIHEILKNLGHEVHTCDSYEEAITIYNRYKAKCQSKRRNTVKKVCSTGNKPHAKKSVRRIISSAKLR